ncbi:MAG: DUF616 domain-containing protein [Paucibacter sp.]|nr:DUF616 domain-containing protein [Roseateles sp.]
MSAARQRLVIYTVLTGSKEPLGDPVADLAPGSTSDLEIGFVCFTDNRQLKSEVWEFRYLDEVPLPPEKLSRRPKALPHEYLQDWDYSLYIDNIVAFKRLPQSSDLQQSGGGPVFKTFKHSTRSNPQQEAEAIVQLGYESVDRICTQLDFYAGLMPLGEITPLSTCTVILREHMHPALRKFGVTWWEQILNFCKRDQMSFDFSIKWSGAHIEYLAGLKHDNELIHNTANIQPNRVHANFDAVRYAWQHRGDAAAQKDPRQHYLDHGRHQGGQFSAPSELFEYICHLTGSSLGGRVAPRRRVAAQLQEFLLPRRQGRAKVLLVRIAAGGPWAFSSTEMERAEMAICAYLPGCSGTRLELTEAQLAAGNLAMRREGEGFDLAIVLGAPAQLLAAVATLLGAALHSAGSLCVLANGSVAVAEVATVEVALSAGSVRSFSAQIHASDHDGANASLRNSVLMFDQQAGAQPERR